MPAISRRQLLIGAAASLAAHAGLVRAQSRDMSIIVAYPPGGSLDAMARMIAQHLGDRRGHAVVVDNKPGFSGNIGAQYVAKAAPNGNTLLMTALTSYAINARLMGSTMGYDVLKSFEHVAIVGYLPNVLIVPTSLQMNDVESFVQAAKARPGAFSYATTGNGSLEHIAGEMFKRAAGIDVTHVPYRGSAPAGVAVMAGQVSYMFDNVPTVWPFVQTDRMRALAVTTKERIASAPQLPTMAESGFPDFDVSSWYGLIAPAQTPPEVIRVLDQALQKVLARADFQERMKGLGVILQPGTPESFGTFMKSEVERWAPIVKASGASNE
jgi:tripartite-type tricarboxylate transporter receptor subunit TctC